MKFNKRIACKMFVLNTLLLFVCTAGFSVERIPQKYKYADSLINRAINNKLFPGGILAVIRGSKVEYVKCYGNKSVMPEIEPMTMNTVFDLASVTKPFTGLSAMMLVEQGKIRLEDEVNSYLPYIPKGIKIIHLLTHTSGISDYSHVKQFVAKYGLQNRVAFEEYIKERCGKNPPAKVFEYSCLNYVCLQFIIEQVSGQSLKAFEKEHIFNPLGMNSTDFTPERSLLERCAPTELQRDGSVLKGIAHDSLTIYMNNYISGNAGLFSSVGDMVIFVKMLLNNGEYNGIRIISPLTMQKMVSVPKGYELFGRSLGWDNYSTYSSDHGSFFSRKFTYGHTGYTGPGVFIDPINRVGVIFLAHRVHPYNKGSMVEFRTKLANIVGGI